LNCEVQTSVTRRSLQVMPAGSVSWQPPSPEACVVAAVAVVAADGLAVVVVGAGVVGAGVVGATVAGA